ERSVPGLAELESRRLLVPRRDELGAVLGHADAPDLVGDAELLEQGHVERQQRLADVEARVARLLDDDDAAAALGEQRAYGRACRPAADHQDVTIFHVLK